MKTPGFVSITLFAAAMSVLAADRPNIFLIMVDDFGYECLGSNGSTSYRTPRIDRLAAEGIRFEHCYSQPLCTPSRVQIMTGRYNFRNYEDFGYLKPTETTFAQLLQKAGYATAIAGKWQLNGLTYKKPRHDDPKRANEAGFDEYCLWQLTHPKKEGERFRKPLIEQNGRVLDVTNDDYGPDIFANFVMDFVSRHKDEPWLVYYPMVLTHDPFVPTPDSPEWQTGRQPKSNTGYFKDMVEYTDVIVGRLVDHLERLGLRDDTIILFTGDNGTHVSITSQTTTGSIKGGKGTTPNAGTHVPFVASWKGKYSGGKVSQDLIDFSDFFLTLADAAGVTPPNDLVLDGRSFLPQLRGEKGSPREWVFCHYDPRWGNRDKWKGRFARDRQFKLYLNGRFYDVPADELEKTGLDLNNLPKDAGAARRELQAVLDSMPACKEGPH